MKTKNILTGMIASFMLLSGPVFAQPVDVGNTDTGINSENNVDVKMENEVKIDVDNDANICNDISVVANTGGNTIGESQNIHPGFDLKNDNHSDRDDPNGSVLGDATINTGDANAEAAITNVVNTTDVNVDQDNGEEDGDDDEDNGQGGGPTPTPTEVNEDGNIGGGELSLASDSAEGIGGGLLEGIGGGELPEAGFEGLILPLVLSSMVTFIMALKRKRIANL